MQKSARIFVTGHKGLVGSAICEVLKRQGFANILTATRDEVDLRDQSKVHQFIKDSKPDYIFVAAGRVGGIHANSTYTADFIYENLMIAANLIHAAYQNRTKKLLYLGSSCIYPKHCPQPMREEHLLTGPLEPTNEAYAVAKIAGLKLCKHFRHQYGCDFIAAMPTNLYGPRDNFHPTESHVLPGLLRRFHEAKVSGANEVTVWGSGKAVREFLYSEDLAEALVVLMKKYSSDDIINVGAHGGISIAELAQAIKEVVGFTGKLVFDTTKPDGTPKKVLSGERIAALGWTAKTPFTEGLKKSYEWALANDAFNQPIKTRTPESNDLPLTH